MTRLCICWWLSNRMRSCNWSIFSCCFLNLKIMVCVLRFINFNLVDPLLHFSESRFQLQELKPYLIAWNPSFKFSSPLPELNLDVIYVLHFLSTMHFQSCQYFSSLRRSLEGDRNKKKHTHSNSNKTEQLQWNDEAIFSFGASKESAFAELYFHGILFIAYSSVCETVIAMTQLVDL